ncbi:FAD-dependent monooxygenase [Bradyrhizobium sp. 156]|uniref:FAD-dependent oxidoreductase n=1 Tax=Bradyrhizobium sp. 156 TaxID=2782630 RepID=UPI001FF7B0CC|nr:FAD-dependent monooxygenase [Bradyrhizobium sp. 156]
MTSGASGQTANEPAVLVVGAGPTGLALALCLARSGIAVRLVDRAAQPATTSRAIGIQARTLELLDLFGLAEELVALGLRAVAGNIHAGSNRLVHLDLSRIRSRFPYILLLEQTETERILTEALARCGVSVERGVEVVGFKHDSSSVQVQLSKNGAAPTAASYDYMVGCDGAHSITRHGLAVGFTGKTLHQKFLLADLDVEWKLPDDQFHIFTSPEGLMAVFPMRQGHRLIAETREEPADSVSGRSLSQLETVTRRAAVKMKLSNLRWSSFFHVNSRLATKLRDGRVLLAGDAAHIHSPAGAQGMNTGIQDAINLGWKLAFVLRGDAAAELIDTYEIERYPVERGVLRNTEMLTRMVSLRASVLRRARDLIVPPVARTEFVQKMARNTISEIGISYRRARASALSGLADGDRIPDLEIEPDHEGRTRLYSVLDGVRFTLLVVSKNESGIMPGIAASIPDRIARVIFARRVLGDVPRDLSDWFCLIRPDAYIALQGPLTQAADAVDWLGALATK